jgi:acyl-CoA thioesterase FadM
MNLIFRLFWMLLSARFGARSDITGESWLTFRCLPTDLDLNFHMTNSRYHSFMDLSRVDFMIRNGAWAKLRRAGLGPVLGSSSIRFRRAIAPFQKFRVTTRVMAWDERWIYLEHKIVTQGGKADGETAAVAIMNTTFVGQQGRVPTEKLMEIIGYSAPRPILPEVLVRKEAMDALMKG